jgi:molybdopterin molybdotransferase
MISVEEARERILSRVALLGAERIELRAALHRVLAEDIAVPFDMPPWPNSSMDGYALRSDDTSTATRSAPTRLIVAGRVPAGAVAEQPLRPGEAFRIFTGAPLPEGADGVIPQEEVSADGNSVRIERPVRPGEFVRPRGEDVRAGEQALSRGRVLGAAEIGLLATFGRVQLNVVKRPHVAIVSTGDELVDLGGVLGPGQIPNSNTYSLMAQVADAGARPVNLGVARDRLEEIETRLGWGLACDALISSAGVSVGEHDYVKAALERLGAEQHLWLVDMRPGKPIAFATIPAGLKGVVPVFALPGNPVSAMVTFELFVRPALLRMAGHARVDRPIVNARALARIENPGHRRGYLRVTLQQTADGVGARLTGDQSSGILRSMVDADGLAIVPGETAIEPGGGVRVLLLRAIDQLDVPALSL